MNAVARETWGSRMPTAWESDGVTERFTPAGNLNDMFVLWYEATIEDPNVFTRPWTIRMPLYRRIEPNAQLMEFRCHEFLEELIFWTSSQRAARQDAVRNDPGSQHRAARPIG